MTVLQFRFEAPWLCTQIFEFCSQIVTDYINATFLLVSKIKMLGIIPIILKKRGRISSIGRALDCRAGGRGFDSRGRTNTQGLKITEKWRYFLCTASGETFAWLGWSRPNGGPVSSWRRKISVPSWYFRAKNRVYFFNSHPKAIRRCAPSSLQKDVTMKSDGLHNHSRYC